MSYIAAAAHRHRRRAAHECEGRRQEETCTRDQQAGRGWERARRRRRSVLRGGWLADSCPRTEGGAAGGGCDRPMPMLRLCPAAHTSAVTAELRSCAGAGSRRRRDCRLQEISFALKALRLFIRKPMTSIIMQAYACRP
jgi:hypothetical protein